MRADEAVALYTLLTGQGVRVWVDGGWGIDALLGQQTRPHKDLDALVSLDDLTTLANVLANCGFTLKEIWGENRWVAHPVQLPVIGQRELGIGAVATAFVVRDSARRELDIHVLTLNGRGDGIPAWNADLTYSPDALAGQGVIAGTRVRCLSARMQMATHTGYVLQAKDLQDLRLLHERFGVAYLEEQAHHFPKASDVRRADETLLRALPGASASICQRGRLLPPVDDPRSRGKSRQVWEQVWESLWERAGNGGPGRDT